MSGYKCEKCIYGDLSVDDFPCDACHNGSMYEPEESLLSLPKAQLSLEGTTSDLISRQAAIDALNEYFARIGKLKRRGLTEGEKAISLDTVGTIKTLPSVQPEPQWIPVSERFPEDYADVLVWFEYFRYGDYNCMYATHGIGNYSKEYNSWTINHETGWKDLHVFAWMPLPEAYKPNK